MLYVHVADDGGLLAIDGSTGRSSWITKDELSQRLGALSRSGGSILLSRELGSPLTPAVIDLIEDAGTPTVLATEPHHDAVRERGATTLMSSAYVGATSLMTDLLQRGADIEARDEDGYTALVYASNGGQVEAVRLLVAAGANVNQADQIGSTPLMFATQQGSLGIVKRLLVAGANPNAKRPVDGLTARDFASANRHDRVAAVLASVEWPS